MEVVDSLSKRICIVLLFLLGVVLALPSHAADTLSTAFECHGVPPNIDGALKARGIPTNGKEVQLKTPIRVFGYPVTRVSAFREGGEDVYRAYIRGNLTEVKAAAEKPYFDLDPVPGAMPGAHKRGGVLTVDQAGPGLVVVICNVTTDPSED